MILVDSSAWVEFDRATGSLVDLTLTDHIRAGAPIAVTEPIVMEVCAGAKSAERERELRRLLLAFEFAPLDSGADFNAAVTIYRTCRRVGVTPRGLIDCLIAAVALRHDAVILAADRDFARLGEAVGLRMHEASVR